MHRLSHALCAVVALITLSACGDDAPTPSRFDMVDARVVEEAHRIGPAHLLLIGDSLTDQNPLTTLCDVPVIRAGYSGGTWQDVAARPIWSQIHSWVTVVQLGTNNIYLQVPLSSDTMHAFLDHIHSIHLLIEPIPPMFTGHPDRDASVVPLQEAQVTLGVPVIDSRTVMNNPVLYVDGIHWNAQGYASERQLLTDQVCPLIAEMKAQPS